MNSGDSVRLVFVHIIRIIANHAFTILLLTVALGVLINVISEKFFRRPEAPPVVSHWLPFLGNTISYGKDPYKFLFGCQKKYGDVFTFVLLGRKQTVYLGTKGNDFILNARHKDVSAEEVYSPLTTPVFGDGVVYDVSSEKFFEQKKFIKFGLKPDALRSYIPLIQNEVEAFVETSPWFGGDKGAVQVTSMMAQLTIFTASRSLQGKEVRAALDESFANLYHDLDMGLTPINFLAPWAPLPHNRKRDRAHKKMATVYMNIIRTRRERANSETNDCVDEQDMINNLMSSRYKDGTPLSDKEIAHMMIALLMAGQHNSASIGSWILLRLASQPAIAEELYVEQVRVMGTGTKSSLSHADLQNLPLHSQVIRETLRIHSPIHSVMRKVKSPLPVEGTPYIIPTSHYLLASPGVSAQSEEYFPYPLSWNPHRWDLSSGNETISKGASSPYLPFGAGRHRCIGEQFAYVQLMVITATMVRHLKFRNVHGREGVVQTTPVFSPGLRVQLSFSGKEGITHERLCFGIRLLIA